MREKYQSISLNKEFIELIKEYIKNKPQFTSVTSFIRYSIIRQMERK